MIESSATKKYFDSLLNEGLPDSYSSFNISTLLVTLDKETKIFESTSYVYPTSPSMRSLKYRIISSNIHEKMHFKQFRSTTWGLFHSLLRFLSSSILQEIYSNKYQWYCLTKFIKTTGKDPIFSDFNGNVPELFHSWQDLEAIRHMLFWGVDEANNIDSLRERLTRVYGLLYLISQRFVPSLHQGLNIPDVVSPSFTKPNIRFPFELTTSEIVELQAKCIEWLAVHDVCSEDYLQCEDAMHSLSMDWIIEELNKGESEKKNIYTAIDALWKKKNRELFSEFNLAVCENIDDLRDTFGTLSKQDLVAFFERSQVNQRSFLSTCVIICDMSLMGTYLPFFCISGNPSISTVIPSHRFWNLLTSVFKIGLYRNDRENDNEIENYSKSLLKESNLFNYIDKITSVPDVCYQAKKFNTLFALDENISSSEFEEMNYFHYLIYNSANYFSARKSIGGIVTGVSNLQRFEELVEFANAKYDPGLLSPISTEQDGQLFAFSTGHIENANFPFKSKCDISNWFWDSLTLGHLLCEDITLNGNVTLNGFPSNMRHKFNLLKRIM